MKPISLVVIFILSMTCALWPLSGQNVEVSGNQLMVDKQPYFIKGICYHPVPKGETTRSFKTIDQDLKLMSQASMLKRYLFLLLLMPFIGYAQSLDDLSFGWHF